MPSKLRRLDTAKGLTPFELEVMNWNWWAIEQALNSVGATTPLPDGTPIPPPSGGVSDHGLLTGLGDDDHLQYLLLAGRVGGQTIAATSALKGLKIVQSDSVDVSPLFQVETVGGILLKVRGYGPSSTPAVYIGNNIGTSDPTLHLAGRFFHSDNGGDYLISPNSAYIDITSSVRWKFHNESVHTGIIADSIRKAVADNTRILNFGGSGSPILSVDTPAGQADDLQRWRVNAATLAKVDKDGKITAAEFIGPLTGNVNTLTTNGDLLTRAAGAQIRLPVGSNGQVLEVSAGAPTWKAHEAIKVGGLYFTVAETTAAAVAAALGYGTWSLFGAGRVIVCVDSGDGDFDSVEETGGAKSVVSAGTISGIAAENEGSVLGGSDGLDAAQWGHTHPAPTYTGSLTSVQQKYITAYVWKRLT